VRAAVARQPRAVVLGAALLGLASLSAVPYARFDDDPLNLRDPEAESVATLIDLIDDPRVQPYSAEVLTSDLAAAEALAARLEPLPEVAEARTLADYVPRDQDAKLQIIEEMGFFLAPLFYGFEVSVPPDGEAERRALRALRADLEVTTGPLAAAARALARALGEVGDDDATLAALRRALLGGLPARLASLETALEAGPVTIDDLPASLRARMVAGDGRALVKVVPRDDLRDAAARRRFVDAVQAVAPEAGGFPIIITAAGRAVVRAFFEAGAYAAAGIVALLLVVLRDGRDSLLVLAPLTLAAVLSIAATVVFGIPFNFANVIVLPLLFGLGVAGGIHIVVRARDAGTMGLMASSTPRAVLLSALTTIGSFGALALSSHRGTASMGLLLTIAITLTLGSTLIVLPALLTLVRRRNGAEP